MDERDRAILAEYIKRNRQKLSGFAHSYVPHIPTPKQRAFIDDDGLEALYGGAAGGGKSDALLMAALKYAHVPGYAAILFRRTFADLALDGALMDRARKWLLGSDAKWNDRDHVWRFPSGASLRFGYLENESDKLRYQSAEFQFIGFDELTQFTSSQYTYLFSRLRRAGVNAPLRMRGATNPGGPGHRWVKRRWTLPDDVDMGQVYEGLDGARFYPAKLDDNPYIDQESYEIALSKLESIDQEQLRKGRWVQDAGLLVYAFDPERDLVPALPVLPNGWRWRRVLGIDYGNVSATALVVLAFCLEYSDAVWIEKSQKWTNLDPDDAAQIVRTWSKDLGGFERMVGDTGGLGKGYAVQAQRRFALPIEAADKSDKLGSIKLINGAAENGRVKIVEPQNAELVTELEELLWKDEKKIEEKPGLENHLCLVAGTMIATERGIVPIEDIRVGDRAWTRNGLRSVVAAFRSGRKPTFRLAAGERVIVGTADHPIFTERGRKPLASLMPDDTVCTWESTDQTKRLFFSERNSDDIQNQRIEAFASTTLRSEERDFTGPSGSITTGRFREACTSIISTETHRTTRSRILPPSPQVIMPANTWPMKGERTTRATPSERQSRLLLSGIALATAEGGTPNTQGVSPRIERSVGVSARSAAKRFGRKSQPPRFAAGNATQSGAETAESTTSRAIVRSAGSASRETGSASPVVVLCPVRSVESTGLVEDVYNLTVDCDHEYFANGILVSNCDGRLYGWKETTAWMHTKPKDSPPKGSDEWHREQEREAERREQEMAQEEEREW